MALRYRLAFFALLFPFLLSAQSTPDPKHEFRSFWLTTAASLDWPRGNTPAEQQQSLRNIILRAKAMGMNAVIFQIASRGDAYYRSDRLPWAATLTGTIGRDPGWDPLQFAIDLCQANGMELHAWFNVFNIGTATVTEPGAPKHITETNPEWTVSMDGSRWLDPAYPGARDWVMANLIELISKYDIDAIHFDFLRYGGSYPNDFSNWLTYGGNFNVLADWRRNNVNDIPRRTMAYVLANKPWVKVGSAPIGHYRSSGGWSALYGYSAVAQDARGWMREGTNDYVVPQNYWTIYNGPPYTSSPEHSWITRDWAKETYGRHLYMGIGAYVSGTVPQIPRMIDTTRVNNVLGQVYFRWENIWGYSVQTDITGPFYQYRRPAIVPNMAWRSQVAPGAPTIVDYNRVGTTHVISWARGQHNDNGDTLQRFAVYRSTTETDPAAIVANGANLIGLSGGNSFTATGVNQNTNYTYVVTAMSRNNVESAPSNVFNVPSATGIDESEFANGYTLSQNFPNPFNPTTVINFTLGTQDLASQQTRLAVYDALGRVVAVLVDGPMSAGSHSVTFDAGSLASGVYIVVLTSGDVRLTQTMTLVK